MELVIDIPKEEYESFVEKSPYGHFMQSYYFGQIRKWKNFIPHYVGLRDKKKLVCVALLLEKKLFMGYSYYYCPRGYVIDFNNHDLVKEFTDKLKDFAKKNKAIFIKLDPAIKLHDLDPEGNIIGNDNTEIVNYLKSIGYKHLGYNLGFEGEQPRFTFRIDLDKPFEKVYSNMHPTTRKILNKGNQYDLDVYKGNIKDMNDFYITMSETSKREGIIQAPIDYYKTFYKEFNDVGMSDLYVVKANIKKVKTSFNNKIKEVKNTIDTLNDKIVKGKDVEKNQNKINDLEKQLDKLNTMLSNINSIKEKDIVLSSIITVKYGDKVWTVHGGNNSKLMELNGNYLCYYTIMRDAHEEGYKCMDCFGTCGYANPDKNNPIYGIHSFKKRLGGEYTEFIGEFDLITNNFMYFAFKTLIPIYRKIKRNKSINKKDED